MSVDVFQFFYSSSDCPSFVIPTAVLDSESFSLFFFESESGVFHTPISDSESDSLTFSLFWTPTPTPALKEEWERC